MTAVDMAVLAKKATADFADYTDSEELLVAWFANDSLPLERGVFEIDQKSKVEFGSRQVANHL